MADTSTTMLAAALACFDAGLCVVPVRADGSKAPYGAWKRHQRVRPSRENVEQWFGDDSKHDGFGVITGAVSGGLEMLELEGRATNSGLGTQIAELADNSGLGALWARVCAGYLEITPTGGFHILYRVEGEVGGNTKLAADANAEVLIETRGEGGFTICAPSGGRTHPSGRDWVLASGGPGTIATISADERDALHTLARAFDLTPLAAEAPPMPPPPRGGGLRPGDDYNARATWLEILCPHGWMPLHTDANGVTYWRRPGKSEGLSATTGRNEADNLYVFTTSTRFDAEKPYSKFAAYALLWHGGDYSAAAKALAGQGYGDQTRSEPLSDTFTTPRTDDEQGSGEGADGAENDAPSSWATVDLGPYLDGTHVAQKPTVLLRSDGAALFYAGETHSIYGESESGKSWVALIAAAEVIAHSGDVLFVDFESTPARIVERMGHLRVSAEAMAEHLAYVRPEMVPNADDKAWRDVLSVPRELVIIDGVTAAMSIFGASSQDNDETTKWQSVFPAKVAAQSGAAVVMIDHVTKSTEGRGRFAIGAQAKLAALTGAAYVVTPLTVIAKGQCGYLEMRVAKDRPGEIRAGLDAESAGDRTQCAAIVEIDSDNDGQITPRILTASEGEREAAAFRSTSMGANPPTYYMGKVSRALALEGDLSMNRILQTVGGGRGYVEKAVKALKLGGYVVEYAGERGARMHRLVQPFDPEMPDEFGDNNADLGTSARPRRDLGAEVSDSVDPLRRAGWIASEDATTRAEVRSSAETRSNRQDQSAEVKTDPQGLPDSLLSSCTRCSVLTLTNPCKACQASEVGNE